MKKAFILISFMLLTLPVIGAEKLKSPAASADAEIKSTVWVGKISAISATNVKVTDAKGKSRSFQIYPGTIFGRGGSATLAEFQKGDQVTVNFSEVPGSSIARAENISPPRTPRAGQAKKK